MPRCKAPGKEQTPSSRRLATVHRTVAFTFSNLPGQQKKSTPLGVLFFGGPEEIRTPDPYNANVMRYQVVKNYAPSITTVRALI